jgi:Fe-S-cluster containining protein
MIAISDLNMALNQAAPAWRRLQEAYRRLPETSCHCDEPGVCCAFLPEMTWIEALQWMHRLKELPEPAKSDTLRKFVEFYLTTPIRRGGCPFLLGGSCSVYDFRPFACRAYGLWSHQIGYSRTQENLRSRQALVQSWAQFRVEIPAETVGFEIDYCNKVRCLAGKSICDAQLMDVLKQIYRLDQKLPDLQTKFEIEYHSDFSLLVASLVLGYRRAILGKFAVVKEIVQQGTEERLQQMLVDVTPETWRSPN